MNKHQRTPDTMCLCFWNDERDSDRVCIGNKSAIGYTTMAVMHRDDFAYALCTRG